MSIKERMDDFYFEVEEPGGETLTLGETGETEEDKEELVKNGAEPNG